jgi:hypothetical protein
VNVASITAQSGNAPYTGYGAGLVFKSTTYSSSTPLVQARIRNKVNDNSIVNYGSSLVFDVTPTDSGSLTQGMELDYGGNLTVVGYVSTPTVYVSTQLGASYSTTGATINLTGFTAGSFTCLEIIGYNNPNTGGSSSYTDPIHAYVYCGVGYSGAVGYSIYTQAIAPPARNIYASGSGASGNIMDAFWYNGSAQSTFNTSSSVYVQLQIANYNGTSNFNIRVIKRF